MTLVSTEWLSNNLSKVKIFDASWHLPNAKRDAKKLSEIGIECYRIQFPHSMDANAYACQVTPAHQSLAALIRGAQWLQNGGACTSPLSTAALLAANDAEMAAKEKMSDDSSGEESQSVCAPCACPHFVHKDQFQSD